MAQRKPHPIVKVDETESNEINRNFDILYRGRPESLLFRDTSSNYQIFGYQDMIHGQISVSANGTTSVVTNVALDKRYNRTLNIGANAANIGLFASVTDITASSIGITVVARADSATTLSAITTASVSVFWNFMGTLE